MSACNSRWSLGRLAILVGLVRMGGCALSSAEAGPRVPISAMDIASLRDLGGLSISPDGHWAAFQVRRGIPRENRYETRWWVVSTNGDSPPASVADAGEPIL